MYINTYVCKSQSAYVIPGTYKYICYTFRLLFAVINTQDSQYFLMEIFIQTYVYT